MSFTYTVAAADWGRIAPELVLAGMVLIVMLVDLLLPRAEKNLKDSGPTNYWILPSLSLLGLAGAFAATIVLYIAGDGQPAFNQMIGSDQGSLYAYIILLSASALGILLSPGYLRRINLPHQGEYYTLMLLATIGMMLLAAAFHSVSTVHHCCSRLWACLRSVLPSKFQRYHSRRGRPMCTTAHLLP